MAFIRNTAQTCQTCAAFNEGVAPDGTCRLKDPQITGGGAEWPPVLESDWCAAWTNQATSAGWVEK